MFYLSYLRNELLRRKARTVVTVLGFTLGVALVVAIAALSNGLESAQKSTLDPLGTIGTDLTVTRESTGFTALPGGIGGAFGLFGGGRAFGTDLSQLGKPGEHFERDTFRPGSQPTFPQSEAKDIAALPGVADVAVGLTLIGVHQEGKIPKIVATFQTGGDTIRVLRNIKPLTAAELAAMQKCVAKALGQDGSSGGSSGGTTPGGGFTPIPLPGTGGAPGVAGTRNCFPARFRRVAATVTTPRETLRKQLATPQTDIKSEPYVIAGVDVARPAIGLVTPKQVSAGRFLARRGGREALVSTTYAASRKLKFGSKLDLNGTTYRVVGLVRPPLGGQPADVYLPLEELQRLSDQPNAANVVLVRATSSSDVAAVKKAIEAELPAATVAGSEQVASQISGSLVDAAELSDSLGLALSIVAALAAFLLAALLTLASIGKRVRELGTLKALGWTQSLVVRQVMGESLAQGLAGGVLGIGLGILAAAAIGAFGPTLEASSTTGGTQGAFGLGAIEPQTFTEQLTLTAPVDASVLLVGLALAVVGGLIAGAAGGIRAARLRPADALRNVE